MANEALHQAYDNVLKRLLEHQPAALLPLLLNEQETQVFEELTIEALLPPRRMDRVYKSRYQGHLSVLHVEFESAANASMDKRMLIYHALLLEKYELPVVSLIIYPFEVSMVRPPLHEQRGHREILTFHYQTLPLWRLQAATYVKAHAVPMYGLLPTMQGITDELLLQAIEEMVQYYAEQEARLREELLCFKVLLTRANRLPPVQLERIERAKRQLWSYR